MADSLIDGKYASFVLGLSTFVSFAVIGITRSSGVFYAAFLREYKTSREEASWPLTVCSATDAIAGPLGGAMLEYTTDRQTCLLASVMSSVGLISCYMTNSIIWTTVHYGITYGIGCGILITVLPVVVTRNFRKHRTTALGIFSAGVSANSLVFPAFMEFIFEVYGLQGLFLILGGISMNAIVACLLIREPQKISSRELATTAADTSAKTTDNHNDTERTEAACLQKEQPEGCLADSEPNEILPNNEQLQRHSPSCSNRTVLQSLSLEDTRATAADTNEEPPEVLPLLKADDSSLVLDPAVTIPGKEDDSKHCCRRSSVSVQGSLEIGSEVVSGREEKRTLLKQTTRLLTRPSFHAIAVSTVVFSIGLVIFTSVIVDYAIDKGLSESQAIITLSAFSLFDLVSHCTLGWITDKRFITARNGFILNMTVLGLLYHIYPYANGFVPFTILSCVLGIFSGNTTSISLSVIPECLGLNQMAFTIGLTNVLYGALSFARPPIIGIFRDAIGSYDWMLRAVGLLHLAANLLWLFERLKKKEEPVSNVAVAEL